MQMNVVQMNVRVYLNVPYRDKEEAKTLCRWNPEENKWYCIDSNYGKSNVSRCIALWGSRCI